MGTPLLDRINASEHFRIEPDPERSGCWQVRNLLSDDVIAVGMHRDTAIQHIWFLDERYPTGREEQPMSPFMRRLAEKRLPPQDRTSTIKGAA